MPLEFKRTTSDDPDFRHLVSLLDFELIERNGDDMSFYSQFNKIDNIRHCIVCYSDNTPIACGAFKPFDETSAEIKRMFVLPAYRNAGVALSVLRELELWASESGYLNCVLETGKRQPEAIRLYEKAGYVRIKNYGPYENVGNSVCMKRSFVI
jgi:putative acetyltransferase